MRQRSIFSGCSLLGGRFVLIWFMASAAWLCVIGGGVCLKVGDQVTASADLGRELAQLDCEAGVRDASGCALASGATYGGSWIEIVKTFLRFGGGTLLPLALLPPMAALVLGVAASALLRRARTEQSPPVTLPH